MNNVLCLLSGVFREDWAQKSFEQKMAHFEPKIQKNSREEHCTLPTPVASGREHPSSQPTHGPPLP